MSSVTTFDQPTGTATKYLLIYPDGADLAESVHAMITRLVDADPVRPPAIFLITTGEGPVEVQVEAHEGGIEFEIVDVEDYELLEYVCYVDEDRKEFTHNNVFVKAFSAPA